MTQQKTLFKDPGKAIMATADFQSMFSGTSISPLENQKLVEYFEEQMAAGIQKNQAIQELKGKITAAIDEVKEIVVDKPEKETEIKELIKRLRTLKEQVELPGKKFLNQLHKKASSIEGEITTPAKKALALAQEKLNDWTAAEAKRIERENAKKIADAKTEAELKRQEKQAQLEELLEKESSDKKDQKKIEKLSRQIDEIEAKPVNLQKELPKERKLTILDPRKLMALLSMDYCFKITPEEKAFLRQQEIGPGQFFTEKDIEKLEFMLGFLQSYRRPPRFPNLTSTCISVDEKKLLEMLELLPPGHYSWGNQIADGNEKKVINEAWGKIFEVTKGVTVRR